MKIAIVSDSHDNLANIYKALDWIKKEGIELILHCGDVCSLGTLKEFAKNFQGQIHIVYGNVDADQGGFDKAAEEFQNIEIHVEKGELNLDGKNIAFVHFPDSAKRLAQIGKYDIIFYGHDHKPWEEKIGNTRLVNPGTLAGMFYKATFAVYDTKTGKLELKILELIE